jgi:colanic acid/amylovoran biosynthesis glycosyltransferase
MTVGYVIKRYPLLSQTFIVNEILAHESAGLGLEIFSLRPPKGEDRHASVSWVKAPVTYIPGPETRAADLWTEIVLAARRWPDLGAAIAGSVDEAAGDIYQALILARLVAERGIRHLHAHFANVATTVARLAGRIAGVPYSFTAHARDIFHEKVVPEKLARKLADASAVITVSDFNLKHLRGTYGPAAAGVRRVYNGLDLSRFGYAAPVKRPPTVISVGRLVEKKGFGLLVDACALLAKRGRTFRCLIVGSGPLEEALREQIARLGLHGIVELVGPRPQEEAMRLVQDSAVFAAPCVVSSDGDRDGLPTVLLEAMALGTPCVSTDVTGIPEVLRDGETGLMVPQHDTQAVADAVERLLKDAILRDRLATAARRLMEHEFDIHRNAARVRAAFGAPPAASEQR